MIEKEDMKLAEEQYSANSIQVLEGLEAVRKRPSMYIGDVAERGLHHLVYEVVDNSIDEAMAGFCDTIDVRILEGNTIRVRDNGRGIPTGMHEKEHRSALEVVLTVLHAGGKFSKSSYKVSGGLHGVGVSCVNALSDSLVAEVHREGKVFEQHYSKGKPLGPVQVVGEAEDSGTVITFHPDPAIFTQTTVYRYDTLAARLRELAFLNKGIHIRLTDERELVDEFEVDASGESKATGRKVFRSETFYSERGLSEFIEYLDAGAQTIIPQPVCVTSDKILPIDIALQYNNGFSEKIYSYVNNIHTIEGGTHLQGFKMGLSRSLKQYAENRHDQTRDESLRHEFHFYFMGAFTERYGDHGISNKVVGLSLFPVNVDLPTFIIGNGCCHYSAVSRIDGALEMRVTVVGDLKSSLRKHAVCLIPFFLIQIINVGGNVSALALLQIYFYLELLISFFR